MTGQSGRDLADAILNNDLGRVIEVLDHSPELIDAILHHPSTSDDTPGLILAASCGNAEIVERLIEMGASREIEFEKEGWRPLHIAAQRNYLSVVQVLLSKGAVVDPKDKRGAKPIQWALRYKYYAIAELLLEHGANIDIRWQDGYAFLNHEAKDGRNETLAFMLRHGADPHTTDWRYGDGTTPLHCAARNDRRKAAEILLEFGANVNAKNADGLTPLDMTIHSKKQKVVDLLLSHGGEFGNA